MSRTIESRCFAQTWKGRAVNREICGRTTQFIMVSPVIDIGCAEQAVFKFEAALKSYEREKTSSRWDTVIKSRYSASQFGIAMCSGCKKTKRVSNWVKQNVDPAAGPLLDDNIAKLNRGTEQRDQHSYPRTQTKTSETDAPESSFPVGPSSSVFRVQMDVPLPPLPTPPTRWRSQVPDLPPWKQPPSQLRAQDGSTSQIDLPPHHPDRFLPRTQEQPGEWNVWNTGAVMPPTSSPEDGNQAHSSLSAFWEPGMGDWYPHGHTQGNTASDDMISMAQSAESLGGPSTNWAQQDVPHSSVGQASGNVFWPLQERVNNATYDSLSWDLYNTGTD
ncbi:hypothetical protein TREMEDRAFT_59719 [Tremella mesenterica DSM 1558]|uniref:uncharacterized protein n=1 Tax=Tremella mesenterica (strain ATCC 24925 / CBS 8224 / DSM 1558 / NBRC 9311 / NRRL Y-6157 / RJB 2259-6 / UBC 559-6) TaxID=578456 RepID=UPI0003F4A1F6|nr:uncharacterized protein TREMEDRAFT_59719 [Tremella mesenterica DSM 1558]EIW73543.1 hypothetical protein TREMEDRAFT_59719 [Tremella mesenterica DSM 1558]